MKNLVKYFIVLTLAVASFTSCIKEEFPTDVVTTEMIASSSTALQAAVAANNAWMTESMSVLDSHADFGFPGICMGLDALTSDVAVGPSYGYDAEFLRWRAVSTVSADGSAPYFIWKFFYTLIQNANGVLAGIDLENPTAQQKIYAGQCLAYRAMAYLYLSQVFEYKGTQTGQFVGLTVPKITETTTELEAQNNPRISHDEMYKFIEDDLLMAADFLKGYTRGAKNEINEAVVQGLLARMYIYTSKWASAETAAKNAISLSGASIMNEEQWMDPKAGFNSLDNKSWMWGIKITSDDRVVTTGICNFVSLMSSECTYGYTSAGGFSSTKQIDKNLYESIPDTDWRKKSWLDPDREKFDYQLIHSADYYENLPDYSVLKFRPGQGNGSDYMTGSAADFPIMRVEEMYLIQAEAAAMQDMTRGQELLTAFAVTRNPEFVSAATTKEDLQKEILWNKRIELWGEGLAMFDLKRTNTPQMRGYVGTNHFAGCRYNSPDGTPCWTTLPIPTNELNSNSGITKDTNNPNPQTLRGTEWVEE